jgi:hypothetical protein
MVAGLKERYRGRDAPEASEEGDYSSPDLGGGERYSPSGEGGEIRGPLGASRDHRNAPGGASRPQMGRCESPRGSSPSNEDGLGRPGNASKVCQGLWLYSPDHDGEGGPPEAQREKR